MQQSDTTSTPPRSSATHGSRLHEGLAAWLGAAAGFVAALSVQPPAGLGDDAWMLGAPLYGAAVGTSIAVLRNGDRGIGTPTTSARTLVGVCLMMWATLAAITLGG